MGFTRVRRARSSGAPFVNLRFLHIGFALVVLALGGGAAALILDARAEHAHLRRTAAELDRALKAKEAQLARQQEILHRLKHDPAFVEKTIRAQLGFAKANEFVFRFED
ncbi:MAG: hypothetical protein RLZZ15_2155 [Verrucomicrobiota bacterium]|jgi:cell division protein FtsB